MKKLFLIAFVLLSFQAIGQNNFQPSARLSPLTKLYLQNYSSNTLPQGYIYKTLADSHIYVSAIIKINNAHFAENGIKSIGGKVGTKAQNIWTVQVPTERVLDFVALPGIAYIQLDEPVFPNLFKARETTRTDSVHHGINLPQPYTGKNVIVGVIDFGFDYNHPTLYDTLGKKYRVMSVWEQGGKGTPPKGFSYGAELSDTDFIRQRLTDNIHQTHGAGVAGIAAGSGFGSKISNDHFRGMAFNSEMVFVGVRREFIKDQWMTGGFSDFLDGINYIFKYANSVGKPAVINISWGSHSGPHDGSTLFNEAVDNLSGPGRLVVMAAGNEGTENIHLSKKFSAKDSVVQTFVTFSPATYRRTWLDVWGDTGKSFCAIISLFANGSQRVSTGYICLDDKIHSLHLIGKNGVDTCYIEFINSTSEFNEKPRMTINIYNKSTDTIAFGLKATDGSVDVWNEYYYYGYTNGYQSAFSSLNIPNKVSGDNVTTVSDMGSSKSVLLVGAYASKVSYNDIQGRPWSYSGYVYPNQLAPFSSRGPLVDGRIKPDITAPGLTLATSVNSLDTSYISTGSKNKQLVEEILDTKTGKTFYYGEFMGTSAASPVAAGITALLLEINPNITPDQLKYLLFSTAITDIYTRDLPKEGTSKWGHGKINAYGAVKLALINAGISQSKHSTLNFQLYPNPGNDVYHLEYTASHTEKVKISVSDITGKEIKNMAWQLNSGKNSTTMNLSEFPAGIYFVKVSASSGSGTVKVVKF